MNLTVLHFKRGNPDESYITGSKSPPKLTDKSTGTASTVPYFIVFLDTDQCVLCRIPDTRAPLNVTVNIELTRGISKMLYVVAVPRKAEVALGVPGRLRSRIISTFDTTRVVGRQPYAPAAFTPGEIPGTQGTWFCRKEPQKKSPVTPPGSDPGTVQPP